MNNEKPIVISLHGIRTSGSWQKNLESLLENDGFVHVPFKYGYYDLFRFLIPYFNKQMVEQFYLFYSNIQLKSNFRPSLVAHSFGTFIFAYCLLKRQHIKFDKVILCGSILPKNFDWTTLLARNQINQIRNEYSRLDFWARSAKWLVKRTGQMGYSGLQYKGPNFFEKQFDYGHSDYFQGNHMREYWLPFLKEWTPIFKVQHGRDISNIENYMEALRHCRNIDKECYEGIVETPLPENLASSWITVNEDIYTFVFEEKTNEVKGYINALPLKDEVFEKLKSGQIVDDEIKPEDIIPFSKNRRLKIYFMSIATRQDIRRFKAGLINTVADRLLAGFFEKLINYWRADRIKVVEFLAIAWTPQGKVMCEQIGMSKIGTDRYGHPIYFAEIKNISTQRTFFTQGLENLINAYMA